MNCRRIRKRLSAYQDGEVDAKARDLIQAHLERCRPCRKTYEELQSAWAALAKLPDIEPHERFYLDVREKISGSGDRRFPFWRRPVFQMLPKPLATTGLLAAGLLLGVYLGNFFSKEALISFPGPQPGGSYQEETLASFRTFDPVPPGTLAHGYLRMARHVERAN